MSTKNTHNNIDTSKVTKFCLNTFSDNRGKVVKPLFNNIYEQIHNMFPEFVVKEVFFTYSQKDVIRGMHFTLPLDSSYKLIFPVYGEIKDVAFSIEKKVFDSSDFIINRLNSEKPELLFIPPSFAHGYEVLSEMAIVMYITNYDYNDKSENAINPITIPHKWITNCPIISSRDSSSISYKDFFKAK